MRDSQGAAAHAASDAPARDLQRRHRDPGWQRIGQLEIVDFTSTAGLSKQGSNYFRVDRSGGAPGGCRRDQRGAGKLEASNTGSAEAAVRLVSVMRQFEMLQKAVIAGRGDEQARRSKRWPSRFVNEEFEMIRALYSAASGMTAQQMNVDNIAHNLANANTAGYKMRRAQFQDLLYQTWSSRARRPASRPSCPTGLQLGLGTRTSSNEIIFTQGAFSQTDNPLDMVIQGKGFFQMRRPSGELAYTRAGAFHLDRDGNMVTSDGDPLEPQITIPPTRSRSPSRRTERSATPSPVRPPRSRPARSSSPTS